MLCRGAPRSATRRRTIARVAAQDLGLAKAKTVANKATFMTAMPPKPTAIHTGTFASAATAAGAAAAGAAALAAWAALGRMGEAAAAAAALVSASGSSMVAGSTNRPRSKASLTWIGFLALRRLKRFTKLASLSPLAGMLKYVGFAANGAHLGKAVSPIKNVSTRAAQSRPSAMAVTTNDAPLLQSPQTNRFCQGDPSVWYWP
mmetsp:Transcript_74404/g.215078  ORF Transcript_74404/g.215078 Transcript_74404/m.215078 type:complete len:203 (-) Transcript_74404:410-1018(-)